ncbi:MAG: FIST N-terminal domain-containing protein [Candidatus Omnitrophota bacterium]
MGTKFGTAIAKGKDSLKVGQEAANKAMDKAGTKDVSLSVIFASSAYDYKAVVKGVREVTNNAPLIGCSTAGEFTEEKVEKESVACAVISTDTHKFFPGIGKGLKEDELKALKDASRKFPSSVEGYPYLSAVLLVDGLAGKGEESALAALEALGPNVKFSGGAAGDDLKFKETSVFTNEEVASDAASLTLVASRIPVAIGVKHGHSPISPPLTITKAEGNVVYEIDGKSAFGVWKEYTRQNAKSIGIDVDKMTKVEAIQTFFTRYEAGLLTGTEYKIRWLGGTTTTEGPINFPCTMSEGIVVRVMESPQQAQISSAKKAAEIALQAVKGAKLAGAIVFDCVCRAVILGDGFAKAVNEIKNVLKVPLVGFETYGEIAMEIGQLSGFHNTTTVVLLIPA